MRKKIIMIAWPVTILIAIFMTKFYWPNKETIEIVGQTTGKTQYHQGDNTDEQCKVSPLKVESTIKNNIINGKCYDDCKSVDFEIQLKARSNIKHIFGFEYSYQYEIGQSYGLYYLYNFNIIQLGGGVIISKTNPGFTLKVQKAF